MLKFGLFRSALHLSLTLYVCIRSGAMDVALPLFSLSSLSPSPVLSSPRLACLTSSRLSSPVRVSLSMYSLFCLSFLLTLSFAFVQAALAAQVTDVEIK